MFAVAPCQVLCIMLGGGAVSNRLQFALVKLVFFILGIMYSSRAPFKCPTVGPKTSTDIKNFKNQLQVQLAGLLGSENHFRVADISGGGGGAPQGAGGQPPPPPPNFRL